MGNTDDELVKQAVMGDRDAMITLWDTYSSQVANRIKISKEWQSVLSVEDVMQVTAISAFQRIATLRDPNTASFVAWLTRIAENNLRDAIRGLKAEKRPQPSKRIEASTGADSCGDLLEQLAGSTTSAGGKAARKEADELLQSAIQRLPANYGKVLQLSVLEALDPKEVAERMGKSTGAVHMLRARAMERLREILPSESKFFTHVA